MALSVFILASFGTIYIDSHRSDAAIDAESIKGIISNLRSTAIAGRNPFRPGLLVFAQASFLPGQQPLYSGGFNTAAESDDCSARPANNVTCIVMKTGNVSSTISGVSAVTADGSTTPLTRLDVKVRADADIGSFYFETTPPAGGPGNAITSVKVSLQSGKGAKTLTISQDGSMGY